MIHSFLSILPEMEEPDDYKAFADKVESLNKTIEEKNPKRQK
jgi:hypothetical protein